MGIAALQPSDLTCERERKERERGRAKRERKENPTVSICSTTRWDRPRASFTSKKSHEGVVTPAGFSLFLIQNKKNF